MFFRNGAGTDFATLHFDHNGKIVVSEIYPKVWDKILGPEVLPASSTHTTIGSYTAGTWGNIAAVVTTKDGKTTMDWFINGAHAFSTPELWAIGDTLNKVFVRSLQGGINLLDGYSINYDGTENLMIDNFKVSYVEEYTKFYATIASVKDNTVAVKFNEPLAANNDLTGIRVKSFDGKVVETGAISFVGDTMYIPLTGAVEGGVEYAVVLPENLSSVLGKKIANNALYFSIPAGVTFMPVYNKVATFDYGNDPTYNTNSTDNNIVNRFYGTEFATVNYHGIKSHNTNDAEHNVVADIDLQGVGDTVNPKTTTDDVRWSKLHDGVNTNNQTDEEIFCVDLYFDELTSRTHPMTLVADETSWTTKFNWGTDKMVATFSVDANGSFVINDGSQTGNSFYADLRGTLPTATNNDFVVVPNVFTADKWYTLKMLVSKKAGTVKTFVGSKNESGVYEERLISTTEVAYKDYSYISNFFIHDHTTNTYQRFYIDNLKYGYNLLTDGVYASANDVNVTAAASETEAKNAQKTTTFAYDGALDNNYMVSFNVTTDNPNFNNNLIYLQTTDDKNLCMIRTHQDGKVQISSGFTGWVDSDLQKNNQFPISKYSVNAGKAFNILLNVDKTAKTADVYLDGVLIKNVTFGGSASTDLDVKKVLLVAKNDKSATGNTENNLGTAGTTATISDMKICYSPITNVKSVRLIDASNEEFGIDSANIYGTINKIKAYYDGDVTADNFVSGGVTLKNSNDEDVAVTSTYDSTENSVTATIEEIGLPNGTYTVTFDAVNDGKAYTTSFTISDPRRVEFNGFKLMKNGVEIAESDVIAKGDTVSVVVDAINEHWQTQTFNVILCEYSGGDEDCLEQVKYVEKTVDENVSVTNGELQITIKSDAPVIKAFIWKDFKTVEPLVRHIVK